MNLLIIPTLQSCSFIFFTKNSKILEHTILDKSKTFSETIMFSKNWEMVENIFFISGPASFTTLRNMSVFLETLKNFSENANNKKYNFYNISTQDFLENFILYIDTDINKLSHLFTYAVGRQEVFIFEESKKYQKIKNKKLKEYIQNNNYKTISGFLSENIINIIKEINNIKYLNLEHNLENNIDYNKIISEIITTNNKKLFSNNIKIDYGSLPTIG